MHARALGGALVAMHPLWVLDGPLHAAHPVRVTAESFPRDLRLLPEHCLALWDALAPHAPPAEVRACARANTRNTALCA